MGEFFRKLKANVLEREAIFILVGLVYALYALGFIWVSSFVLEGERYFVLFDDMMISMRYARNLALGYGLVWNAGGERVEGYTNLLWTIYMALIHFVPLAASKISVLVQITGAVCILITLFVVKKIAEVLSRFWLLAAGAMVLTAFYLPLNNWALLGTEVALLTLLYSLAIFLVIRNLKQGTAHPLPFVVLGVATLVRLDMVVAYIGILAMLLVLDLPHWRTNLAWGVGLLVLFLAPQTLFRLAYYGELLPNTYYLKMTGFPELLRVGRGALVAWTFVSSSILLFILAAAAFVLRRDRLMLFLGGAFCVPLVYSIYVGGDAWELFGGSNRYISIAMPCVFVMAMFTLSEIARRFWASSRAMPKWGGVAVAAATFAALIVLLNQTARPQPWAMWLLGEPSYGARRNLGQVRLAQELERVTAPDARIAVVLAGTVPYFTDRYMIDLLGKSDKKIAREAAHFRAKKPLDRIFYPGHQKWNYEYSIGELKPDVVTRLYRENKAETLKILTPTYTPLALNAHLFVRTGSRAVLWDKLSQAQP
jgi:hypothetical protein